MRHECSAEITVDAPPQAVWDVIADVTRVGEWSGECRGGAWVEGAQGAMTGARFRGRNRRNGFRWTRVNEILVADPPHRLAWRTLSRPPYPDSVEWCTALTPVPAGTHVAHGFEIVKIPRAMEWLIDVAFPPHRDRQDDLLGDLRRLKALVEGEAAGAPSTA